MKKLVTWKAELTFTLHTHTHSQHSDVRSEQAVALPKLGSDLCLRGAAVSNVSVYVYEKRGMLDDTLMSWHPATACPMQHSAVSSCCWVGGSLFCDGCRQDGPQWCQPHRGVTSEVRRKRKALASHRAVNTLSASVSRPYRLTHAASIHQVSGSLPG